jgi:hypothetical protein
MTLNVTVQHGSTELELDLDELDKYGSYFIDRERGLIIHASVYTHGTRDSRYVRGDVTTGTDYTFKGVSVNRERVREYIDAELQVEISDGELETAVSEYHVYSTEVVGRFSEMLDGKRILGKAQSGVVSTGSEEPLLGWEDVFSDVVDRALEENDDLPRRDIVRELFNALCEATPGENEYSARIELVNPS